MKLNKDKVNEMVEQGYVEKIKHPTFPLYLLDYSRNAQLEHVWNDVTMQCRGLIVDEDYNVIANTFPKFFNYEEINQGQVEGMSIPSGESFKITEKLDGSMGTLYWYNDEPYITTRGSFISEQAVHATKVLREKYASILPSLNHDYTYIFEIIYPENHIIVSYGGIDDIFLIGVRDTETGEDKDIRGWGFKTPIHYDCDDYMAIRDMVDGDNKEGFVVLFESGFRMKMKFDEYFRLHSLKSHMSEKHILDCLKNGETEELEQVLATMPEEDRIYFSEMRDMIQSHFYVIEDICHNAYRDFETDKEAAEYFKTQKYPGILFNMRKGKKYDQLIWKIVKQERKIQEI